jgi:rubrerythrin
MKNFNDKIDDLIKDEQEAIDGYNEFLDSIKDNKDFKSIQRIIDDIIYDERQHKSILKEMKSNV